MSYLEQYDAIPADRAPDKVKFVFQCLRADLPGFYKELREKRPIFITPAFILVTLFSDVQEILRREEVFSVRLYQPKMNPTMGPFMLARDNTEINWREKSIMKSMMQLEELPAIRKFCGEIAKGVLNKKASTGQIEVVNELARYVPIQLCGQYFGFPGPNQETMYRWSKATQGNFFKNLQNDPKVQETCVQVGQEMKTYLGQLLQEKKAKIAEESGRKEINELTVGETLGILMEKIVKGGGHPVVTPPRPPASSGNQPFPHEDIFTRLIKTRFASDIPFDEERIIVNMMGLLIGSVETTSQALVQALEQLLLRPEILQEALKAAKANDDQTFDKYVWEALRFNPMNPFIFRFCEEDYTVAAGTPRATRIPAKSVVYAATASAMFDGNELPDPETFSIHRPDYHYMHFGYGHHTCLGDRISTMLMPEVIKQILLRPGVRLVPGESVKVDLKVSPFPERFVIAYDG